MKTVHFSDAEYRRVLALVRCQALIEQTPEWDELLELLDVDSGLRREWGETVLLTLVKGGQQ